MSDKLDRALDAVATFDLEANKPRDGWLRVQKGDGFEHWCKVYAGFVGFVVGQASQLEALGGAGCWSFVVRDSRGEVIAEGKSSRRGWAMEIADESAQTIH